MEFSAVFIHEDYYIELLQKAEPLFHLNMFHKDRKFPCRDQSYMFISFREPAFNQGVKVNLDIKGYVYLEGEYLVALVHLKTNFTDFINPHIILANRSDLSDDYIRKNLKGKMIPLPEPLNIKGKIDINIIPFAPAYKQETTAFKPEVSSQATIKLIPHPWRETSEKSEDKTVEEPGILKGPRGGKFKIVNGKKKYL